MYHTNDRRNCACVGGWGGGRDLGGVRSLYSLHKFPVNLNLL